MDRLSSRLSLATVAGLLLGASARPALCTQVPLSAVPAAGGWTLSVVDGEGDPVKGALDGAEPGSLDEQIKKLELNGPLPEGWKKESLEKDRMFRRISGLDGKKTILIKDGKPAGIRFAYQGEEYLFQPGQPYAVSMPRNGEPRKTLRLTADKDGKLGLLEAKPIIRQDAEEEGGDKTSSADARALADAGVDPAVFARAFDGKLGNGGAPDAGTLVAPAPSRGKSGFLSHKEFHGTLNPYGAPAPEKAKEGSFVWIGEDLLLVKDAKSYKSDGSAGVAAVGYTADMGDSPSGSSLVFWHGGAAPDEKGEHERSKGQWALFSVAQGKSSVRSMGLYSDYDLRDAKYTKTAEGRRLELASALTKPQTVYRKSTAKAGQPGYEPVNERQQLLIYGDPVGKGLQRYYAMDGTPYSEVEDPKYAPGKIIVAGDRLESSPGGQPSAARPVPVPSPGAGPEDPKPAGPPGQGGSGAAPEPRGVEDLAASIVGGQTKPAAKDGQALLAYLGLPKEQTTPAGRELAAKAALKAYDQNMSWGGRWNDSEVDRLWYSIVQRFRYELEQAKTAGDDARALRVMADGLTRFKAEYAIENVLGKEGLTAGRLLLANAAGEADLQYGGIQAVCLASLKPENREAVAAALGPGEDVDAHLDHAAEGLVGAGGVVDLAKLLREQNNAPVLVRRAVLAVGRHKGSVSGVYDYFPESIFGRSRHMNAALEILKAGMAPGQDQDLRNQAHSIGQALEFSEGELVH